jgi:hypothetical protein
MLDLWFVPSVCVYLVQVNDALDMYVSLGGFSEYAKFHHINLTFDPNYLAPVGSGQAPLRQSTTT